MVCIAITVGGWGDVYQFDSRSDAESHPVVQYGDAIMTGPEDITRQYNTLEIGSLLEKIGDESLRETILMSIHPDLGLADRVRLQRVADRGEEIWDGLLAVSSRVPEDPSDVVRLVQMDRERSTKETNMNDTKPAAAAAPKAEKVARAPRYADTSKITLLADKEGKKFGKDNNPKRANSKAADRFAKLTDGMTVAAFVKAVGSQSEAFADLDYGVSHSQLKVEAGTGF